MKHYIKLITPYRQNYETINDDLTLEELRSVYQKYMEHAQKGTLNFLSFHCEDGRIITMSGDLFKQCIVEII